jgi:dolichol-phosphate mannosyltransferase
LRDNVFDRVDLVLQFTDNASSDETWTYIVELVRQDSNVKAFRFARNRGFQESILFNFAHAEGDAVVQIDADLQDPMGLVEVFIDEWLRGAKVVSGVRIKRQEAPIINQLRSLGYRVISRLADFPLAEDVGDFRLLDIEVVSALRKVRTPSPFLRAIISGFGFPEVKIPYIRAKRSSGVSKFGLFSLIRFGFSGLVNHSRFATNLFSFTSIAILALTSSFLVLVLMRLILGYNVPAGYTSILFFIAFNSFLMTFGFAILSFYIYKVFKMLNGESYVYFQELPPPPQSKTNFSD